MLEDRIRDDEVLYRALILKWFKNGRLTSAAFKQKNGASVDRDGGREEQAIIDTFEDRMPGRGLALIAARQCRDLETNPVANPIENNPYHAEIHDSQDKITIGISKARKLSKAVTIIKYPNMA